MKFRQRLERNDEMVARLVERFKPMFPDPTRPNVTFPLGWESLVTEALTKLAGNRNYDKDLQILQIKDKFGGLRIYTNFTNERIGEIISAAELLSSRTCIECGATEEYVDRENYSNFCKTCRDLRSKDA
jgi:hypothetical protein